MKYMTFNSSCAYAGVANMLERYGVDTDDRDIALNMKLPYLFACENGVYLAGPMLQSARWFNLYLNTIGFEMTETEVPADQVPQFLVRQKTAMLGFQMDESGKHAVVYTGCQDGKLVFINNKWETTDVPEQITLTEAALLERIQKSVMIATLEKINPRETDIFSKMKASTHVMRQNLSDIQELCRGRKTVGVLRTKLNTLFRPLLLDGITMLQLLEENELAQRFTALQRGFLNALRQEPDTVVTLSDYLCMEELSAVTEEYIHLIKQVTK